MNIKIRFVIAILILVVCVIVNYFAASTFNKTTYGVGGIFLASIAELVGSIAIPLGIFLLSIAYKLFKKIKVEAQSIEYFIWASVVFALLNSVPNLYDAFVNTVPQ